MRAVKINYDSRNLRSCVSNQYMLDRSATGQRKMQHVNLITAFAGGGHCFQQVKVGSCNTHTVIARVISILLMLSLQCE